PDNMFQPPKSLVDAVRDRTLVPFVGAGISVGAVYGLPPEKRFPDWDGLIRRLAERLKEEGKPVEGANVIAALPADAMAAAQLAADSLGRKPFVDEMQKAFEGLHAPPGADLSAAEAIWRLRAPFVITTNYDMVLGWSREVTQVHNDDPSLLGMLDAPLPGKRQVWHLHGSITRPDTMILTSGQYEKLYPVGEKRTEYQNAFNHFQHLLTTRSFLFLGFSLAEPVLRTKLEDVLALTAKAMPIKFLLLRAGQATDAQKAEFFEKFNVQVVEYADFGGPMVAAIDAVSREAWPVADPLEGFAVSTEMRPLVEALLECVKQLAPPPQVVARLYNAAKPGGWEHALKVGDGITLLHDAIRVLGTSVIPANGPWPLLGFTDRLKDEVTEPYVSKLGVWIDDVVERLGVDTAARARIRQQLVDARAESSARPTQVLVRIVAHPKTAGQWLVHAWSWSGDVPDALFGPEGRSFDDKKPEAVVMDLLEELEAREVDPDRTSISFLVARALACEAIDRWGLPPGVANDPPIGATYMVTVRSLERLEKPPLIRRRLRKAWDELKKRAAEVLAMLDPKAPPPPNDAVHAVWLDAPTALRKDLGMTLQQQRAVCAVLRDAPCATALDHLSAVLDTTTPAIMWYRDATASAAHVEMAIRTLLESVPISELPRRLREERQDAFDQDSATHPGVNLTLIWENADYLPPEYNPDAKAKLETS
ncbi:MAG: VMAP-C domain-containing protein, partial [Gemmatimonadaceae bacterium]